MLSTRGGSSLCVCVCVCVCVFVCVCVRCVCVCVCDVYIFLDVVSHIVNRVGIVLVRYGLIVEYFLSIGQYVEIDRQADRQRDR
jgi:hypothetical protein